MILTKKSEWTKGDERVGDYWEISGSQCYITLQPRPRYCDRGNWLAIISTFADLAREFDHQDGWPRYYLDFDRAKLEIEDWMKKRGQWV